MAAGQGFSGLEELITKPESDVEATATTRSRAAAAPLGEIRTEPEERAVGQKEGGTTHAKAGGRRGAGKALLWIAGAVFIVVVMFHMTGRESKQTWNSPAASAPSRVESTAKPVEPRRPTTPRKQRLSMAEAIWCTGVSRGLDDNRTRTMTNEEVTSFNRDVNEFNRWCYGATATERVWSAAEEKVEKNRARWRRDYRQHLWRG